MYSYCYRYFFGSRSFHSTVVVRVSHRALPQKLSPLPVLIRLYPIHARRCNLKNKQGEPRKKQKWRMIYTLLNLVFVYSVERESCNKKRIKLF